MFRELKQKLMKDFWDKNLLPMKSKDRSSEFHSTPYVDSSLLDWTKDLEANHIFIRREVDSILNHLDHISRSRKRSADQQLVPLENKGEAYFLYGSDYKAELNCARCPITTQLIEKIPGMTTAFFSILGPGKRIPEKKGHYKDLVRYQLGVKVTSPDMQCGIKVEGQTRYWEEGESLVFDDAYPHEVWNNSNEIVVVLCIDALYPHSSTDKVVGGMFSSLLKRPFYIRLLREIRRSGKIATKSKLLQHPKNVR